MSQKFSPKLHTDLVNQYWQRNSELRVGLFIAIKADSTKRIKKTVRSLDKLQYKNRKVYLIDSSSDASHKSLAKKLGVKYIYSKSEKLNANSLGQIIRNISDVEASISLHSGVTLHKQTLRELVPYLHTGSHVVLSPLAVKGTGKWSPTLLMALRPSAAAGQAHYVPLSFAAIDKQDLKTLPTDQLVFTQRSLLARFRTMVNTPIRAKRANQAAFAALLVLLAIGGAVIAQSYRTDADLHIPESPTISTAPPTTAPKAAAMSSASKKPVAKPAVPMTDPNAPTDLVFTISRGDTMSGLISQYINQMHAKYPQITVARLGYAQDYLMRHYGYYMLPATQTTFTVSAADVIAAWSVASNADANAAFWQDYAARAGII